VRLDPDETPYDRNKNWLALDDFGPSDQVFDWMDDRLAESHTGRVAWGVDYSASVSTPRWHCVIIP
jgi:hypothetical protein